MSAPSTPWTPGTTVSTAWNTQTTVSTGWGQVNYTPIPGFILLQNGTSRLLLQDNLSKLQQE